MPDIRNAEATLEQMGVEIFELYRIVAIARSRRPLGPDDLSETEFLTLDLLCKEEPLTIGEIQKRIGVVPAQMSRIVRALEEQGGRGYIECSINPEDRRKVDLTLTESGRRAHDKYRSARLESIADILRILSPQDRGDFIRILHQIRQAFESKVGTS